MYMKYLFFIGLSISKGAGTGAGAVELNEAQREDLLVLKGQGINVTETESEYIVYKKGLTVECAGNSYELSDTEIDQLRLERHELHHFQGCLRRVRALYDRYNDNFGFGVRVLPGPGLKPKPKLLVVRKK